MEKFQERSADHHSSTYVCSGVGVEGRVMDDKSSILNEDGSSPLEVVCGAPGQGGKFRKFLGTSTHSLTNIAVFEINSVS